MSEQNKSDLQEFVEIVVETYAAELAKSDTPTTPEAMADAVVNYMSNPNFWDADRKAKVRQVILPIVAKWYRGQ